MNELASGPPICRSPGGRPRAPAGRCERTGATRPHAMTANSSLRDDHLLLRDPEGRTREIDEVALVREEIRYCLLDGRVLAGECVQGLEPDLCHAVERFGRPVIALLQRHVHLRQASVRLDVPLDPHQLSTLGHDRGVDLAPVALELLDAQVGPPAQAVDELQHRSSPCPMPLWAKGQESTRTVDLRWSRLGRLAQRSPCVRCPATGKALSGTVTFWSTDVVGAPPGCGSAPPTR